MTRWVVKFNQWFNGSLSTAYVTVETERPYIREALDAFDRIGYVNARVIFVRMSRADEELRGEDPA